MRCTTDRSAKEPRPGPVVSVVPIALVFFRGNAFAAAAAAMGTVDTYPSRLCLVCIPAPRPRRKNKMATTVNGGDGKIKYAAGPSRVCTQVTPQK